MVKIINQSLDLSIPEVVLFDTDDTLYEYGPANKKAEEAVANKIENLLGISSNEFYPKYHQAKLEIKEQLGHTASSHSRLLYFQRLIEIFGLKAQLLIALDLEQTFWRTFLANAPLFPGVKELFTDLRNRNIPLGIVTDLTSNVQLRKLTYFGLEDIFDVVVTSEETGADKPDKKIFELALKKLGLSNRNKIWMIGDNPTTDIYGGARIGATTFQKVHKGIDIGIGNCKPDIIFHNFAELSRLINHLK
tara:strand:- start:199 stop:942 length:744 start_codon:yes stop_codon:yes gene_type:complete